MSDPLKTGFLREQGSTEEQLLKNEAVLRDFEDVMKTSCGRRFIWRLMGNSNLMQNAMTGNSYTYYLLGQQSISNELVQILFTERFLPLFRQMQDEALLEMKAEKKKKEQKDV